MNAEKPTVRVKAPAKINLFLQVRGRRPDQYHELFTLMCPIGLFDVLSLTFGAGEITTCNHPDVPLDETNLARRAARAFSKAAGRRDGIQIAIDKNIPVAAGLGGGSSDAASVLLAMNRYYGAPLSVERLMELGRDIGADVPFFLFRHPAVATGIGEKLVRFSGLKPFRVLLIYPGFKVSTAETFRNLNLRLTNCKKNLKDFSFNKTAFDAGRHLCNDLETVTATRFPEILSIKSMLLRLGAAGASMSGSGPSVFGLFTDWAEAESAYTYAVAQRSEWGVFLVDLLKGESESLED